MRSWRRDSSLSGRRRRRGTGKNLDEILQIVRRNLPRTDIRAAFDTLEYLKRGGRIGKAQALMGSMLKVNPIVMIKDGVVEPAGRAHSRAKAIDYLYDLRRVILTSKSWR